MTDKSEMWKLIYNIHMFMTFVKIKMQITNPLSIYFYK